MLNIISWKIRAIYLITLLAAGAVLPSCSPSAGTGSTVQTDTAQREEYKSTVRSFFHDVVGQGNEDAVHALLAPECRYYDAGELLTENVQEFIAYLRKARKPFDSIGIESESMIAEGNRVAVRYAYHSVREGKPIVVPAMAEFLMEDGKITTMWRYIPARSR